MYHELVHVISLLQSKKQRRQIKTSENEKYPGKRV